MSEFSEPAIVQLCQSLQIDSHFFMQCLNESVVEITEFDGNLDMGNGSALRLRQLERICLSFKIDLPVALLLLELTHKVAELEEELRLLRAP